MTYFDKYSDILYENQARTFCILHRLERVKFCIEKEEEEEEEEEEKENKEKGKGENEGAKMKRKKRIISILHEEEFTTQSSRHKIKVLDIQGDLKPGYKASRASGKGEI